MDKFLPFMTNDTSVGLFNDNVDDIYHSAYGAVSEAYEKFVYPSFFNINNISNVLDICYGIGYNTKCFLNELIKKNINKEMNIDCVDINKPLMELSPFILSSVGIFNILFCKKKLFKNIIKYSEAKKIIENNNCYERKYKIDKKVNLIILKNLIENFDFEFLSDFSQKELYKNENLSFLDNSLIKFYKNYVNFQVHFILNNKNIPFVHNIYYKYVSKRYDKIFKDIDKYNYKLRFFETDIRQHLMNNSKIYDLVFLDGFTPYKCPCIWTVEFFDALKEHLSSSGIIVTYNTSAPVRNAMKLSGLYIGKILSDTNKCIGTIASKNNDLIKYNLSDKELGLLNTKAGIPYHDINLSLDNDTILLNRNNSVEVSNAMSSSKYLKRCKNEI